jgi:hypothetical protein
MADDDQSLEKSRLVTRILADLDLLFSVSANTQGHKVWELGQFEAPEHAEPAVVVHMGFNGPWLAVLASAGNLPPKPAIETLLGLLTVPIEIPLARVCVAELPDATFQVAVSAEIAEERISVAAVREAIGAVIECTRKARKVVNAAPAETSEKTTRTPGRVVE